MSYEARTFWFIVCIILAGFAGYNFFPLRIYFIVLGIGFLTISIVSFVKYQHLWPTILEERYALIEKRKVEVVPTFREHWQIIRGSAKSNDLQELKLMVIDADTLLEEFLRSQGIEGDTMASLIAEATFSGMTGTDALLRFHRLRNRIVHESTFVSKIEELRSLFFMVDNVLVRWGAVLPPEA